MLEHDLIRQYWQFRRHRTVNKSLQLWTVAPKAHAQSQSNFDQLLDRARRQGVEWLVVTPKRVQFIGGSPDLGQVFTPGWANHYDQTLPSEQYYTLSDRLYRLVRNWVIWRSVSHFHHWTPTLVTEQHQGFYRVNTGKRVTNRLDQMDVIWCAGFLARRGRPLTCAAPDQYGTRESLEHLCRLNPKQLGSSDHIYRKLDQLYRATNRDCCWPSDP